MQSGNSLVKTTLYVAVVWRELRPKQETVGWNRLLRTSTVPKHVIIAWMAIQNKLPSKDRLASWVMEVELECVLCHHELESRNHLFFGCKFSCGIWQQILYHCGIKRKVTNWKGELN